MINPNAAEQSVITVTCNTCGQTYMDDSDWSGPAHADRHCIITLKATIARLTNECDEMKQRQWNMCWCDEGGDVCDMCEVRRQRDEAIARADKAEAQAEVRGGEWCEKNRAEGRGPCGACAWCCQQATKERDEALLEVNKLHKHVEHYRVMVLNYESGQHDEREHVIKLLNNSIEEAKKNKMGFDVVTLLCELRQAVEANKQGE